LDNAAAVREVVHERGAQLIDVRPPPPGSAAPESIDEFTDTVSVALAITEPAPSGVPRTARG
jgi:hypothetical protein